MLIGLTLALWAFQNDDIVVDERFRVEYVVLDVLATTRQGDLVTDLTVDDFVVTENRKKVDINYFDVLDLRNRESASITGEFVETLPVEKSPTIQAGPSVPQVILALDMDDVEHLQLRNTFDQVREFLVGLTQEQILLNIYSLQNGQVTEGFVASSEFALADFDEYVENTYRRMFDDRDGPNQSMRTVDNRNNFGPTSDRSMLQAGPKSLDDIERALEQCMILFQEDAVRCVNDTLRQVMDEQETRSLRVINQLESLMYRFQETNGLKIMYFISPGFSISAPVAPQQLVNRYLQRLQATNRPDRAGAPFMPGRGYSLRDEYQRVVHAFVRNRVVFNTIDMFNTGQAQQRSISAEYGGSGGMELGQIYRQYEIDMDSGLVELAEDSGGSFHQVTMIADLIDRSIGSSRFFYVLGYQSPSSKPGKFRKLKVKVKRKGVKVSHRKGYIGAS